MEVWLEKIVEIMMSYGVTGLMIISFAESSFFPIPPDFLLIPMAILNHELAIVYGLLVWIFSVLGGIFGYFIGIKAGRPILVKFFDAKKIAKVEGYFEKFGGWAVFIAGLTPIPYKIFTIASGAFKIRKTTFIWASILGRGLRFMAETIIIFCLGDIAGDFISKYFDTLMIVTAIAVVLIYFIYKFIKRDKKEIPRKVRIEKTNKMYNVLKSIYAIIAIVILVFIIYKAIKAFLE